MQNRNILIFTMIAMVTSSFFLSNSYAQLSKTYISRGYNQVPPGTGNDTPAVCTEIPNNGYLWRIQSDHFPLRVGDRMIITMFKNGIQQDSCLWVKKNGLYSSYDSWKGMALEINNVISDDGGYYQLMDKEAYIFDDIFASPISEINLNVFFGPFPQEFSDACDAPDLKFFARDNNVWSIEKNITGDRPDVIKIAATPSSLAPVLFTTIQGPGTLSFTLGHIDEGWDDLECTFRIIDSQKSDTLQTYKVTDKTFETIHAKRYTFNIDKGLFTFEWQRQHGIDSKSVYNTSFLDSILFIPEKNLATSPRRIHSCSRTFRSNDQSNNVYDISGRTIQKFTQINSTSNVPPRLLLKSRQKN